MTQTSVTELAQRYQGLDRISSALVATVQQLSFATTIEDITYVVKTNARKIAQADGATFVFRDHDLCFYADEDAIGPLWKGKRFPMATCISGWVMLNRKQVVIENIYQDPRIPHDAYRPTFVNSLLMTPIRSEDPIGAIGTYWAKHYVPTKQEIDALQALADATSIALENVRILQELKSRVQDLEQANHQLGRLTWLASHDLKEPARGIQINVELLRGKEEEHLDAEALRYLTRIEEFSAHIQGLVHDLLQISRVDNHQSKRREIAMTEVLNEVKVLLQSALESAKATLTHAEMPTVRGDPILVSRLMQNLISNALKFVKPGTAPKIHVACEDRGTKWQFEVRDNGIGIETEYREKIFDYFTRLQNKTQSPGSGVGLALCKRIIEASGGSIWVESQPGQGSSFFFTLDKA